jgi:hypothetical protein
MQQTPSRETNKFSDSLEIPRTPRLPIPFLEGQL